MFYVFNGFFRFFLFLQLIFILVYVFCTQYFYSKLKEVKKKDIYYSKISIKLIISWTNKSFSFFFFLSLFFFYIHINFARIFYSERLLASLEKGEINGLHYYVKILFRLNDVSTKYFSRTYIILVQSRDQRRYVLATITSCHRIR